MAYVVGCDYGDGFCHHPHDLWAGGRVSLFQSLLLPSIRVVRTASPLLHPALQVLPAIGFPRNRVQ